MSKGPPKQKMKQADIQSFFPMISKKQTTTNTEHGETSQAATAQVVPTTTDTDIGETSQAATAQVVETTTDTEHGETSQAATAQVVPTTTDTEHGEMSQAATAQVVETTTDTEHGETSQAATAQVVPTTTDTEHGEMSQAATAQVVETTTDTEHGETSQAATAQVVKTTTDTEHGETSQAATAQVVETTTDTEHGETSQAATAQVVQTTTDTEHWEMSQAATAQVVKTTTDTEHGETSQAATAQVVKTTTDTEHGETSQAATAQVVETTTDTEHGETSQAATAQRADVQEHAFCFEFNSVKGEHFVECDTSMTVLDALEKSGVFQRNRSVKDRNKEIIILREKGAAVKTDFPCCLIEKDEILKITFIKKDPSKEKTQDRLLFPRPDLVTFFIKSTGKVGKVKYTIENKELRETAEDVCVYGLEEENVKTALKRDGRFNAKIFQKLCVLSPVSKEKKRNPVKYEMSHSIKQLKNKTFQIIAIGNKQLEIQQKLTEVKTENASAVDSEKNDPGQPSTSTGKKTVQERDTQSAGPSTTGQATQNSSGDSVGSFYAGIEEFLHTSFNDIMKKLKQRKNPQIQKFYQEDYDKGIQCFTEVNKVRQIMTLSDSVCMIVVENSPVGTGFLAFDRFVLTNAHVIKDLVIPNTLKLSRPLTAIFNYEVVGSEARALSVKEDVVAYGFEPEDSCRFHDFALLELKATPENCPELFKHYKHAPPPNRGGIYIVGHPDRGVKKMDPCFIIEPGKQLENISKHISENMSCPYVPWGVLSLLHQNRVTYDSCLFHGSSGSPVFDEHCYLIGMHSGGFHYKKGEISRSVIEYAYSMQSIVEAIVTQVRTRPDIFNLLSEFESCWTFV